MKKFSALEYVRPDFKEVKKQLKEYRKKFRKVKTYPEFKDLYIELEKEAAKLATAFSIASIRNTMDKTDSFYEGELKYFNEKGAAIQLVSLSLSKKLLKSPFRKQFDEEYGPFLTEKVEKKLKLMSPLTVFDAIRETRLMQQYSKDVALCETEFRGEKCNFYGLLKHMQSTDRQIRKEAFFAWSGMYESVADKLDAIYDKLVRQRVKTAKKLGFKNYIDYAYQIRERYDYTKKEVEDFRNNVRDIIVPVCQKLYEKQRKRLNVETLHFYDEGLKFPEGNALPIGDTGELIEKAQKMYDEMSRETSEFFRFMRENELFDLETRAGKHLGGYCTFLPEYKAPFIFSNFNGTSADIDVLTHEAGHAFQIYLASRYQKSMMSIGSSSEINEIHSMAMEHFAYDWMPLFFGEKADKYLYAHLTDSLTKIPYMVAVDEFQHRVFENPKMSARERRAAWHQIEKIYLPWRSYDGNRFMTEGGYWLQKQHIFIYPFYYVDYALAQVCSYELYIKSLKDRQSAWKDYVGLCQKGGSMGYFDLLKSSNLKNPFKKETLQDIVCQVEEVIAEFEKRI
ncbi:MAG TPA: M3 family oligoendopeptidase [Erysipelotrichaceae bacterium]|nr:M3 family oligoendopeptidase [Erysipelotrichaceae bacterium]